MDNLKDHPIIQFYIENNHFGKLLGMDFKIVNAGEIIYKLKVLDSHLATPLAAHGGAICSLMDATMGVCALSNVILDGKVVSTIEMKISFISPAKLNDVLTGSANTIKGGSRLLFIEGKIENQEGDLIAIATGTFNAYPSEKAGF
tara:strand:+ start:116 stop:550 length:435 start_codon:yes stop_codon:yes gene_type:complete